MTTVTFGGNIMSPAQQTNTFNITVQPSTGAGFVVKDSGGNILTDGEAVTLADATVGTALMEELFTASGGVPPYNFALSSGAVPDGTSMQATTNADGSETVSLEGTPTTAQAYSFGVTISDSSAKSGKRPVVSPAQSR